MRRIKILYQSSIPHVKMGGQKSLLALIDNLDYDRYEPEVIIPESGPLGDELEKRGVRTYQLRVPGFKPTNYYKIYKTYLDLKKIVFTNNIKIIHSDHDKFMFLASFLKKQVKTVYHARVVHSHKYDKYLQQRLDAIIGISEGVLQRFDKSNNADKLHKIYNGVDCNLFSPIDNRIELRNTLELDTQKFTVLFVGQMKVGKGIFDLLKTADILKKENIQFLFVGDFLDTQIRDEWMKMKDDLSLSNVECCGQKQNIQNWMKASDVLILPSHEGVEGMGRVLFEAMACGTPTIASDTSGVREAITPETGILFTEKSVNEIADAILELKNDNQGWQSMSVEGRNRALSVFDIKIHANKVQSVYQNLLNDYD